jgi:hypothetical protein
MCPRHLAGDMSMYVDYMLGIAQTIKLESDMDKADGLLVRGLLGPSAIAEEMTCHRRGDD